MRNQESVLSKKAKNNADEKCLERIKTVHQYESAGKSFENLNPNSIKSKEQKVFISLA